MGDFGAPNALKIYPYTTGSNNLSFDDDDSEEEFVEALASHFHLCESASNRDDGTIIRRKCRVRYTRLDMATFMQQYINDPLFVVTIRMERLTFKLLASLLERDLKVDTDMASLRGGQISIEMCVYLTLRHLAGGSFHDIKVHLGISKSSFYRCFHKTCAAICNCSDLSLIFPKTLRELEFASSGFENISEKRAITNCVGAVDGYLLSINTPQRSEVGNVRQYFSGHYQKYGLNVQAVADANCMFRYFNVSGPGSCNDRVAILKKVDGMSLHDIIEGLPDPYIIAADAAYKPTEHVVPIFYGTQRHNRRNDNFNYALAQCRIRVEMTFGLMQAKWRILRRPLENSMGNIKNIANTIARLHNFVLQEQHGNDLKSLLRSISPDEIEPTVPNVFNDPQFPIPTVEDLTIYSKNKHQTSVIRQAMVQRVAAAGLERPDYSPLSQSRRKTI